MITVLVAEDEPLMRAGLIMLLSAAADIEVVAQAGDGAEAVRLAGQVAPSVVLMDLRMPVLDGVAATRALCRDVGGDRSSPDRPVRVLILTTYHDDESVLGALRAGASGYVLKQAAPSDLVAAVRQIADGEAWLDPRVAGRVIDALARTPVLSQLDGLASLLTAREREVLVLLAEGLSNAEISERLVVGVGTVKTHVSRILMKSGSRDRGQAVALAYRSGIVSTGVGAR